MSDRSVVYLALGRPVVLQETGWTRAVAPSEGMLVFHDIRDCAEAIRSSRRTMKRTRGRQRLSPTRSFRHSGALKPLLEKIL